MNKCENKREENKNWKWHEEIFIQHHYYWCWWEGFMYLSIFDIYDFLAELKNHFRMILLLLISNIQLHTASMYWFNNFFCYSWQRLFNHVKHLISFCGEMLVPSLIFWCWKLLFLRNLTVILRTFLLSLTLYMKQDDN